MTSYHDHDHAPTRTLAGVVRSGGRRLSPSEYWKMLKRSKCVRVCNVSVGAHECAYIRHSTVCVCVRGMREYSRPERTWVLAISPRGAFSFARCAMLAIAIVSKTPAMR